MPITIQNLNYTYDPKSAFKKDALKNINLTINDGEFFGIIGHTGSGKSTLISHLNALIRVQSGKIIVDDIDLSEKKLDFKKLRSKVGMVFQYPEYQLFDETVFADVAFGPKNMGLDPKEIENRVKQAIELVGLDYESIKDRSPFELSGGQMRRVALSGVIAMRPEFLVLDEPTAGLDPRGKKEIMTLIQHIKKACKTVIMISHNMDEVSKYCDRIAVLSKGELKGVFTPNELFKQADLLKELNLGLPKVTDLALNLRQNGLDIKEGIINEDELVQEILRAKGVVCEK